MAIYWTIAILTVLINLFPVKKEKHHFRLFVSIIPLFLYGALRVDFGLDYNGYEDFFNDVKSFGYDSNNRMEIGYSYLNQFLPSFRSLLILQSLLLSVAYYYLFRWYVPVKWTWLGFLLLFLNGQFTVFFMLSGIRNGIAISIFILSTIFIQKRKIVPFAVLVFVAYLFHNSVIMFAPIAYFVANGKSITKRSIIVWLSIMVFLSIASATVVLDYVDIFITTYFDRYSSYVEFAKEQGKGAGFLVTVFSLIVSAIVLLLIKNKKLTSIENMIVRLTLLFFIAYLLGPLNMRMSQYFASFFVIGSVLMAYRGSNRFLKLSYFSVLFVYLLYALKVWFESPYFSYDTYHSILF